MAKSSFWLNGAKGKFAGATIYNADGQSVMRVINKSIKNPRTTAQMVQRVISKTVMNQYAAMKAICDHSFQGKTAGAKCMAHFASINNKLLRKKISDAQNEGNAFNEIFNFIPCKSTKFIPTVVVISEGSLPQIFTSGVDSATIEALFAGNTYEDVINTLGLQRGDQLTFVTVEQNLTTQDYVFKYARVILDPRNTDGTPADLSTAFVAENKIVKPSFRNEGEFYSLAISEQGHLSYSLLNDSVIASAVIASRQVDNDWLRSTAVLNVSTNDLVVKDNISLAEAIARSNESAPIYTNSQRYLNNAGEGGPQASDAPQSFMVSTNRGVFTEAVAGATVYAADAISLISLKNYPAGHSLSAWNESEKLGDMLADEDQYDITLDEPEPKVIVKDGETTILTIEA